jgi:hypothetical protein
MAGVESKWRCEDYGVIISNIDNALAQGIFEKVKAVVNIQLGHQVSLVSFYSFGANEQHSGYLRSRVPFD